MKANSVSTEQVLSKQEVVHTTHRNRLHLEKLRKSDIVKNFIKKSFGSALGQKQKFSQDDVDAQSEELTMAPQTASKNTVPPVSSSVSQPLTQAGAPSDNQEQEVDGQVVVPERSDLAQEFIRDATADSKQHEGCFDT
ncbi:unnamed protein product [Cyclocybe aegerita]|uniref:Uncharacterized protein n=1 Tax=Cyclocybe aegerita TaxID=1973307 RepID=A0A8S0W600_CYCAE|nr:unnamed protein product [Cyclocybe aegerita]